MSYGVSTPRGTTLLLYLHARPISKEKLFLSLLSTFMSDLRVDYLARKSRTNGDKQR